MTSALSNFRMNRMSWSPKKHERHEQNHFWHEGDMSWLIFDMRLAWANSFLAWEAWAGLFPAWERHERNHFWHERHDLAYFRHEGHEPDYFRHVIWILAFGGVGSCGEFSDADLYSVGPSDYTFFFISGIDIRPKLGRFCAKYTGCRTKYFRVY